MLQLQDLQAHWALFLATALLLYSVSTVVYRLYFDPLSTFPGPKLAAATLLYEAYYDVVKRGQYTFKIRELHKKYGLFLTFDLPTTLTRYRPYHPHQSL